jgi:calpain-15
LETVDKIANDFKVVEEIIGRGKVWTDPQFPPGKPSSLYYDWKTVPDTGSWQNIVWRRADEFLMDTRGSKKVEEIEVKVFDGEIEPEDCVQGALGDCYLICAISILAEYENRIKDIFITDDHNEAGIYAVTCYIDGKPTQVIVDDNFPCIDAMSGPIFSRANGAELWVLILEKVWAKIYGSYQGIILGLAGQVMHTFTGAPYLVYDVERDGELWDEIMEGDKSKFAIAAYVPDHPEIDLKNEVGIIEEHVYAILQAKIIKIDEKEYKILQLRNPWGKTEWKGDWSDNR